MKTTMKQSIICSQIQNFEVDRSLTMTHKPQSGDVAVFEVIETNKHTRIQLQDGINHTIYPGDRLLMAFGTRYATSQLEGFVPKDLLSEYHVLGQGGVVGEVKHMHVKYEERGPTRLKLIGYATKNGQVLNTHYYGPRLEEKSFEGRVPSGAKVILSLGGSMDSGKTTTAGYLCRGIRAAQSNVSYIKLTGTVYNKDKKFVQDCGAHQALDFADFGFPSTYMYELPRLLNLYQSLLDRTELVNPDYIVIEIADGLLQRETSMLLSSTSFMSTVDEVIYSDGNSTGALFGIQHLLSNRIRPFAICGSMTASPLLIEEVQAFTEIPVVRLEDLELASFSEYFRATSVAC